MKFEFDNLKGLLRKQANDPAVIDLIGRSYTEINRSAYQGYVALPEFGISVVFKEAPWVVPPSEISDPKMLYLNAFHFRREGHDGYSQYPNPFPKNIAFGDSKTEIESKFGKPDVTGGGGVSKQLKRPIPYWYKYRLGPDWLHLQFDADGKLEMVTLQTPDLLKEKP